MNDEIMIMFDDDGTAREYRDDFDITIHCETKEEQEKVWKRLAQDDWIPCSKDLPKAEYGESKTVLTTCCLRNPKNDSYRWLEQLYFNGGVWCWPTGETYVQRVLAWKPLPEPYRGEQE